MRQVCPKIRACFAVKNRSTGVFSCQTALAEAEIEYHDESALSIFVKFRMQDDLSGGYPGAEREIGLRGNLDYHALDPSGESGHRAAS